MARFTFYLHERMGFKARHTHDKRISRDECECKEE